MLGGKDIWNIKICTSVGSLSTESWGWIDMKPKNSVIPGGGLTRSKMKQIGGHHEEVSITGTVNYLKRLNYDYTSVLCGN